MRLLVLLQNAWARRPMEHWDHDWWLDALRNCRTGGRLCRVVGEDWVGIEFDNTTPKVGVGSNSKLPPDDAHVLALLDRVRPNVVLACGDQAEKTAQRLWGGNLLCIPHPAMRVLTNALLDKARETLYGPVPFAGRVALRQGKGFIARLEMT